MIRVKVKTKFEPGRVVVKARKASITKLGQAGAYIRGIARKSIKVSPKYAPPGKQPHSRKGRLKDAIVYSVEKDQQRVVIGPTATAVGQIGRTHEFGGVEGPKKRKPRATNWKLEVGGHGPVRNDSSGIAFAKLKTQAQVDRAKAIAQTIPQSAGGQAANKSRKYPARPFMGPAYLIAKDRLPKLWANSVKP